MAVESETKKDLFTEFEHRNPQDVRWLFYLSRNGAWVTLGDELYKVRFTNQIKNYQREDGIYTRIYTTSSPLTWQEEDHFKRLLGKTFTQITAVEKNTYVSIEETANITLQSIEYDFSSLQMNLGSRTISLQMNVWNFDADFAGRLSQCATEEERKALEENYRLERFIATKEAVKNQVWSCVASGDWRTLALIYDPCLQRIQAATASVLSSIPQNEKDSAFLYETYRGKTVAEAMKNVDPAQNPPFSNDPPNYSNVVSLLITKGHYKAVQHHSVDLFKQTASWQCRFFKSASTPLHAQVLAAVTERLQPEIEEPSSAPAA